MKKVLILCFYDSFFLTDLEKNLIQNGINVRRLVTSSFNNNQKKDIRRINRYIKKAKIKNIINSVSLILFLLKAKEEIINLHFIDKRTSDLLYLVSYLVNKKIILTFYGSDFYRINNSSRFKLEKIIKRAYKINFTNKKTKEEFDLFFDYKYSNKLFVVGFGIKNLEVIKAVMNKSSKIIIKEKINIPPEKMVVTCGYGAIKEHQHEKIIEELVKLNGNIKNKCIFLFPMTYGYDKEKRIKKIRKLLEKTNLEYIILTEFLIGEDLANIRICTDIMINLQTTDQFSASMTEHIFAGSYIIAGKWLPYDTLLEMGISSIFQIDSFYELNEKLTELINKIEKNINEEKILKNQEIIWYLASWKRNIIKWLELYE